MMDYLPGEKHLAILEMLLYDDDVEFSSELDAAWEQALFFLDPARTYPTTPNALVGRGAAIDILLEASKAGPETCVAVRALVEREWGRSEGSQK